ncbi:hypothetical protein NIES592_06285 [Fischerella major NIES-592]|uniref:Uncharacterized protein n=3 Tax=Fischerella TaxID=1190 RepID=A0A1U7H3I1_9CYAN|nr:hypothetical protein NIES592_06285 [Fischerella major NIES-592]PLZ06383.1 hypothetical protein CBP17_18920 [Fischerella thermalis WC114]PLZ06954.1 hypothetical protein CBP18_18630 [Fischerella thermalis WC119]PLZ14806.1 hypothetical protein CBP19_07745 [Fischerella thermalis WC1110]PLZ22177.1 hypothetical protein CBP30_06455 [Fischerella thermalis WC157]PLZ26417.1 hypothetical protein CBP29_06255 [Fischerella thermalis WC341]PLZ29848.1 hypothetical protein CBP28_09010 [Fischerella thermali
MFQHTEKAYFGCTNKTLVSGFSWRFEFGILDLRSNFSQTQYLSLNNDSYKLSKLPFSLDLKPDVKFSYIKQD